MISNTHQFLMKLFGCKEKRAMNIITSGKKDYNPWERIVLLRPLMIIRNVG